MRYACIEVRGQLGAIVSLPRGFLGGVQVIWLTCKCPYWLSHLTGHSFLCVFVLFYTDLSFGLELTNWAMPTGLRAPRIHQPSSPLHWGPSMFHYAWLLTAGCWGQVMGILPLVWAEDPSQTRSCLQSTKIVTKHLLHLRNAVAPGTTLALRRGDPKTKRQVCWTLKEIRKIPGCGIVCTEV